MKFYTPFLLVSTLSYVSSQLTGNQGISTHHYDAIAGVLDTNPVYCGVLGKHMDITRITAVQGLAQNQCGTCLKLNGNGKTVYVMALDRGGKGLDLNKNMFMTLFGEDTGIFEASWEPTDSSNCQGIVTGGDYQLPGMAIKPKVQVQIVSTPEAEKPKPEEEKAQVQVKKAVEIKVEDKKEEQVNPKGEVESKPKQEEKSGAQEWCKVTGASRCSDTKSTIDVCAFGIVFPITCPAGTTCAEKDNVAHCVAIQN